MTEYARVDLAAVGREADALNARLAAFGEDLRAKFAGVLIDVFGRQAYDNLVRLAEESGQDEAMTEPTPVPPGTVTVPFDRPVTLEAGTYVFEVSGDGKRVIRAIPVTVTHPDSPAASVIPHA